MKKRKPPIILITCVVVFAAGAVMFNAATSQSQNGQEQAPPPPPPANAPISAGKPRAPQSTSSIASSVKQQSRGLKPAGGPQTPMAPAAAAQMASKMPSMEVRQTEENKPKPNDSSISTQWYSNESNEGTKK